MQNWVEGLNVALDCVDAGEPADAERLCRQMLDEDGENQAVLLLLGLAIGAQGEFARAQPILVRVGHAEAAGNDRRHERSRGAGPVALPHAGRAAVSRMPAVCAGR